MLIFSCPPPLVDVTILDDLTFLKKKKVYHLTHCLPNPFE